MTSRIYRRRPPKDGGTIPPTTGDTLFHPRYQYHNPNLHTNYYQILSRNNHLHLNSNRNTSTRSVVSPFRQTKPIGHCLNKSHSTNTHTNLDDFTLIKRQDRNKKFNGPRHEYDKKLKYPKCKKLRCKVQQSINHQLLQRRKNKKIIPTTDKFNMKLESRNFSEIDNKNLRSTLRSINNSNNEIKQRKSKSSFFTGKNIRNTIPVKNSSAVQLKSSKMSTTVSITPPVSNATSNSNDETMSFFAFTIDASVENNAIHAIPLSETWHVYQFNCPDTHLSESDWKSLSDKNKYDHLLHLKIITDTTTAPVMIDPYLDDNVIKAIPVANTWSTYIFNVKDPSYNEAEWNSLDEETKYETLLNIKLPSIHDITSPFSSYVIMSETDDSIINTIPIKDCKLLLTNYATVQGFPQFVSRLDDMSVNDMRIELLKAKAKLTSRPQQISTSNKKANNFTTPFILTHDIRDEDILTTSGYDIMTELQSMYTDRNIYDSVEWDSLSPEDLRDMARMERDEMLKCIETSKVAIKTEPDTTNNHRITSKNITVKEVINIADSDSESEDEPSVDEDGDHIFSDVTEEPQNETDKFIADKLENVKKEQKTFQFKFTYETSDSDIFLLSHRRAIRIAQVHATRIEEPLPQTFIDQASTEEIQQYLIHERNEFIYQHEYEEFNLSSKTTDNEIKSISRLQLENFIIFRYRDTDRQLSDTFFNDKTDIELKYLIISERDMLKAKDTTTHVHNNNNPVPPNTMPKGLFGKRQNLNGWNINDAMSKREDNIHKKVFHPSSNSESDPDVIAMSKNYFYIRASISTVGNGSHMPTIVRRFVKALRNSDSTMQLQPFETDDTDLNHILDTESLIPDDPTSILTWVRGAQTTKKRITFSIRVSNTCPMSELRTDIFGWCKTNKCWIDMDYINSEKLFACGWICGIHPRLYNRNELKKWIDDHDPAIGKLIKIYPRTIFVIDDKGKKTITNGIIIDGAIEEAKSVMKFLYSLDWSDQYKEVNFVPFRASAALTVNDQKQAMEFHNNYLNTTYRKIVKVANPNTQYECGEDEKISFREWLMQSKLHGKHMIEGVESMKDGLVRIIYNKQDQKGVDFIMNTLKDNAVEAFGEETAIDMLGDDFNIITHFNSELEDQHASKIKSSWKGKPTSHILPPQKQHKIYYGSNSSESIYQAGETKSYSEITQSTMSRSDTQIADSRKENEDLRNMVLDLKTRLDSMEKNQKTFTQTLKTTLKSELMKEFDGVISDFRKEMNATVSAIESKFDNTIKKYEELGREREERINSQSISNFRLVAAELAAELLNKQIKKTPSETSNKAEDLRGGGQ